MFNVVSKDGRKLNRNPVALWCAERMAEDFKLMFDWECVIVPALM